jgi:hypothetical protein
MIRIGGLNLFAGNQVRRSFEPGSRVGVRHRARAASPQCAATRCLTPLRTAAASRETREPGSQTRRTWFLPRTWFDYADEAVGLVLPRAFLALELAREVARAFEQVAIDPQLREAQVAPARLAGAEKLSFTAQLKIDLRELEAVGRVDERLQPRLSDVGQLELVA